VSFEDADELIVGDLIALGSVLVLKLILQSQPLNFDFLLESIHKVAEFF